MSTGTSRTNVARAVRTALAMVAVSTLVSCAGTRERQIGEGGRGEALAITAPQTRAGTLGARDASIAANGTPLPETRSNTPMTRELYPGTGRFINERLGRTAVVTPAGNGDVNLTFNNTDIREVIKTILGDLLKENYVVDDAVKGKVFLETSRPLPRAALIPALESVLRMNGAVLVKRGGLYQIVPDSAVGSHLAPGLSLDSNAGAQMLLVPLRYISAGEMRKILEPFKPAKGMIEVDPARNLLIMSGSQEELANLLRTVNLFDVDQFRGMSVGIFPLKNVDVSTLLPELKLVLGMKSEEGLGDMVRLVSVERLNALLVVTPQADYLSRVEKWVTRLDRSADTGGLSLHVYRVQNGRAEHLAEVLSQLYGDAVRVEGSGEGAGGKGIASPGYDTKREAREAGKGAPAPLRMSASPLEVGNVRIIADKENNALVVKASAEDYAKIERAISKLDVVPLQVLVEATIVEIKLTDDLTYGLEWFFRHNGLGGFKSGDVGLDLNKTPGIGAQVPGFSYTITDSAGLVRAVLNSLANESKVHVISSPSLMVLDNHTATINVGDQVPVRTSESSSTATPGDAAVIVSQIQFRDTGVKLEVTPRVNSGGMVTMDITQAVSNVTKTESSSIDSPTISQREITTSVAVNSQDTIVLGGLIKDDTQSSDSGVPFLRRVPVIGWLFGGGSRSNARTELLVLITPTAVRDSSEARAATEEMKRKMHGMEFPHAKAYQPAAVVGTTAAAQRLPSDAGEVKP